MGNFATPYIVTACEDGKFNPVVALSIMMVVIGTIPLLFIRETVYISEDKLYE